MRWLVNEIKKPAWQQGLPSLNYLRSTIIHFELKRLDGLKPQQHTLWLWWKPGCCVEPIALIRKCKVVPFNASFMFLKRLREALRERGVSWCYPVKLPFLFFLPPSTHALSWATGKSEIASYLSSKRVSDFASFVLGMSFRSFSFFFFFFLSPVKITMGSNPRHKGKVDIMLATIDPARNR